MDYDRKKILQRMDKEEDEKKKMDEMYKTKHRLFDFLHFRLKTLVNLKTSQRLGWYKRSLGEHIRQYYHSPKESRPYFMCPHPTIGDFDKIIGIMNMELEKYNSLTNKQFKKKFGSGKVNGRFVDGFWK
jgi:hypothetical protein